MRAVVVAAGDLDAADLSVAEGADLVIAADAGASSLDRLGHRPDLLVGDLDSVDAGQVERLEASGTRVERHPIDKDASDTELAMRAAVDAGATEIVLLGAIGGRLDHEVANLLLLTAEWLADRDVRMVRGAETVRLIRGAGGITVRGAIGDVVSLIPIGGDAIGVSVRGLRWSLNGSTLHLGETVALSNEGLGLAASVQLQEGLLLVVEASGRRGDPR